ncbi:hypothetical protein N0V84_006327 [Fusarium piperis]|uniref:Uncharacterized protein n=1 Tax=Fusarium piperis TaxID=1435070 RepID=A0A9W8WCC7_9HYPO|nr:hypothetical protein N0V84_006327 [Fusarium piperis]
MASSPTHGSENPVASSGTKNKVKLAARNLRIDPHLPYKDDDPSTCELTRGSPVAATPPLPAKSKRRKTGPGAVPMDSLLAPKSTVFTPPLPFRRDEPAWRPPRFDRGSRPRCPKRLDLSTIPRLPYFMKNGIRVYATRGTTTLPPLVIPAEVPIVRVPAVRVPIQVPENAIPPAQVSPMKAFPKKTAAGLASTDTDPVLGPMPFPDPQTPICTPSSNSLPEIMTRQRRRRKQQKQAKQNRARYTQVNQDDCSPALVAENPREEQQQNSLACQRERRDECDCTLCEDCCVILTSLGMVMTIFLSVSTALSKAGEWLVSLTPPEEFLGY